MNELAQLTVQQYKSIIAPFLMMTSCATLVWALQARFSRLVHAIRSLVSEGRRDNIDYTHSLAKQIAWLKARSCLLRNSIVCLYFAMCSFMVTAMLLAVTIVADFEASEAVIVLFLLGLILISISLANTLMEISRSYDSLAEEVNQR